MSKIHLTDDTVNDAVRLHKFAFIDLYHQTFKASIREAEYAWHKCRASRPGRLLALQLGAKPVSAELAQALAAAIPRPPRPPVSVDWRKGDVITFVKTLRNQKVKRVELTVPIHRVFVHTDDQEYAQYLNEQGRKVQVLVKRAKLVSRKNKNIVEL